MTGRPGIPTTVVQICLFHSFWVFSLIASLTELECAKKKSTLLVRRVRINGSKKTFRWFPTTVRELSLVWLVLGRGIRLVTHDGIYFDCLITKKRKEMMNIPDSLDVVTKEREGIGNVSASGWPTFYRGLCLRPPFFVFQVPPTPLGRRRPSFTIRQTQRTYKKKGMLPESKWRREGARYWVVVSSWLTGRNKSA